LPKDSNGKNTIAFEGAMSASSVFEKWVNGRMYYSYFILMFSIHSRRRQYFIRQIINKEFASRWYPGAGLYRNVSLSK
jgi:beta-galactosidase